MENKIVDPGSVFNLSNVQKNVVPSGIQPPVPVSNNQSTTAEGQPVKRGRGRPRKNPLPEQQQTQPPIGIDVNTTLQPTQVVQEQYVPLCNSTDPYEGSYMEGTNLIRHTILQMDQLANDVKAEFDNIRMSKQLKGRYTYMSNMGETLGTLLNGKLSAIKELNAITTKCHELEMKRYQQNKELQKAADDDRYIADMYNAYINTPLNAGMGGPAFMSMTSQNAIANPAQMMSGVQVMPNGDITDGYSNYMNNITPEQNRMILENDPNIETVVVYDRSSGGKCFDVIDTRTGYSVPNYPKPAADLLDETNLDLINGIASNSNIGQSWKIVVQGDALENF